MVLYIGLPHSEYASQLIENLTCNVFFYYHIDIFTVF